MKKLFYLSLAALMLLSVSCKKDDKPGKGGDSSKYGVDGVTPLPEAVDLGLASGVKWASFNLGASKDYEYGDYYAWGETQTYYSSLDPLTWRDGKSDGYGWNVYSWCNGAGNKLTKYCPKDKSTYWDVTGKDPDGEVKLLPSDDVAHVKLGGKWRMPTLDDIDELLALKTNEDYNWEKWALAKDANGNEVKDEWGNVVRGIRITRKSTGAALFLPAAGYNGASVGMRAGSWGDYWSSSLSTAYPEYAYDLLFDSADSDWNSSGRYFGLTVRPVSE